MLLSGRGKKKARTINVVVQVVGDVVQVARDDVYVTKHAVVRADDMLDAEKKDKWDGSTIERKSNIGVMLHLHRFEYFNMDCSIKPTKNDTIE